VDAAVVERDYDLAHVVAQLHHARPEDGGRLVFKGGTALRFVYLPDYRHSAALDFTAIDGSAEEAAAALGEVLEAARNHAGTRSQKTHTSRAHVTSDQVPPIVCTPVDQREAAGPGAQLGGEEPSPPAALW
jgi:predicted nucleotidyltransferase component of viral defense system